MRSPLLVRTLLAAITAAALSQPALAGTAGPTTYSLARKAASAGDMSTSIHRDGTRETIKMTRANGWHSQTWFDFATHKEYAEDSNAPGQCSVIAYTSDGPPELLDPIPAAFAMAAQIPANAPRNGKASLGGIQTSVLKMPGGGEFWLDEAHHMVIKANIVMEGNPTPQTMFDLSGIRFDKPDAGMLAPPAHCKPIAGSANAHGGHAETGGS
ncbi:MAG TPA: hypothetical protein VN043_03690 [Rhodanobacter sp.]|nr:hypothetical protein [Rhodanobacter sp.]